MTKTEFVKKYEKLLDENKQLKEMLINEHGDCADCIETKLNGFSICYDCDLRANEPHPFGYNEN